MKRIILLFIVFVLLVDYQLYAQDIISINDNGSALLDVNSTNKGFLLPRMTKTQIGDIENPAEGLFVYCTSIHKPAYYNGTQWLTYDGKDMNFIGDYFQGGVIFYLDDSGGGLICAISDQASYAEWGCYGTDVSGADGQEIGTGAQNTIDIVGDACSGQHIAASVCANLSLNGYTDWYLPSRNELNAMYFNREIINSTSVNNGGNEFENTSYWSSTEFDGILAKLLDFNNGNLGIEIKYQQNNVRAIRSF